MENITFYHTPLQKELLIAKIKSNQSLKEIFKKNKNITKEIDEEIKHRIDGQMENWLVIYLKGSTGSLKSSIAQTIAQKKLDPTFNKERIKFEYEKFREELNDSKPKQTFQLDEQVFTHGTGSNRIIQDLQNLIETLRKRQNSMILVSPELKYFPEESFTFVLETIDDELSATCKYNQKPHEPRKCNCYQEQQSNIQHAHARLAVKKGELYLGFYIIKIEWNNQLWNEYKKMKDEFIDRIRKNELHNTDYRTIAKKIMNDQEYEQYKKNKKSLTLLIEQKHPNLTIKESELIAEQIKILQRQQEEMN